MVDNKLDANIIIYQTHFVIPTGGRQIAAAVVCAGRIFKTIFDVRLKIVLRIYYNVSPTGG